MMGIISFSLYGEATKYSWGMIENAALSKIYYPGWVVRVYLERGHYAKNALLRAGAQVVEMDSRPGSGGMFWRFLAAEDLEFTHMIVRDADSRINPRDAACTAAWLLSGKSLHVIRDHPAHLCKPIMGGAWGMLRGKMKMQEEIDAWPHTLRYGDDEDLLWWKVWERFRLQDDFLVHSFQPFEHENPIPPHAEYNGFVCEPIISEFRFPKPFKALVLRPESYQKRMSRFFKSLAANEFLNGKVQWYKAKTAKDKGCLTGQSHACSVRK